MEPAHSKRPHVKTERMQEFIRSQGESCSPQKRYKCPEELCNKVFTSTPGLKYHLQTHGSTDLRFSCYKCHKGFKSANGLKYHRERTRCEDVDVKEEYQENKADVGSIQQELDSTETQEHGLSKEPAFREYTEDVKVKREYRPSRLVPPPLDLSSPAGSDRGSSGVKKAGVGMDKLTELAIIATSPQSPLMQKPHALPWEVKPEETVVRSLEQYMDTVGATSIPVTCDETTASVTESPSKKECHWSSEASHRPTDPSWNYVNDGSDPRVSTSSPLPVSQEEDPSSSSTWSHSWPTAVWQCFIKGTQVQFVGSGGSEWQNVETLAQEEELSKQATFSSDTSTTTHSYAPDGLQVLKILSKGDYSSLAKVQILFKPRKQRAGEPNLVALCVKEHPFFVNDKGWSSLCPGETVEHYGIPCRILSEGDVCLPPSHKEAAFSVEVFESIKGFDFTPEDTSAVFALSSMRQRKGSDLSPKSKSECKSEKSASMPDTPTKSKRPMNAFMLFAKEFRLEYTQQYPRRDNRAISVMLGEKWKALSGEKRQLYEMQARQLAEEQKKIHPDCWKRKK